MLLCGTQSKKYELDGKEDVCRIEYDISTETYEQLKESVTKE